ncbi:glycosyltransferase [Xanthomonas hortorum]|uniref:D-inositol-3-phosphate glycosyltransferase n=2 Tax=Xanthomonas hortorum TaxID=56454 RepID=A0A6V7C2T2_9XANT|nr:glycosyltransferase [Xanthomonas hortorum]MCC4624139.1 glycosyltransferase [Xanthomonas campestris pv. nigromaculans]APP81798.1 glycosyl transferase [Xanthomonas hortorum pv. gardneri]EGD18613.1 glycosyltransferase [Xanthomonas hortorum ATCC 19865]KLA94650.1 glycosyl transferase [Xanthomonas hortorum pv. gardneri]KLA97858.1 glycosyl transferase [Xanthomonas hortorum pv. gardneri]
MHRLTVVQLLPALQSGGVERSTLEIAAALVRAGHRAVVVSAGGRLVQPLLEAGGEHLTLEIGRKSLLTLRHVVGLRRLFTELGADIVHARSRLPAWLGWYALRGMPQATRPRFVTTVHGLNSPSRYSAVMTYGERVICVSQTVRDYVCTHYPQTDTTRLRTIARGVDIAQFPRRPQPDHRARKWVQTLLPGWPADAPLLLLPGRGTRLKGHADGLQLLADVRAAGVPAWLWLPGAREPGREAYVRELEAEAARLGVAEAVAFTEPTARIAEAYAASDLVLQLSRKPEAFGRTVVEALSVGRPVLGWAHGGVGELLAELQPAGAVPAFDAQALSTQALGMLQHAPTPPAALPYTLQAMQSATLKVYDELRR